MDKLKQFIEEQYELLKDNKEGKLQDYIKKLAQVSPDLFSISCCDVGGNMHSVGESDYQFSIQSCSKPITYCIAREKKSMQEVHTHVGMEPSGVGFNEIGRAHV